MIKLFDFKFLILLGLTLVVYFLYKEIDMQRERIQNLEDRLINLVDKHDDELLSLPDNKKNTCLVNKKDLKLELPIKMVEQESNRIIDSEYKDGINETNLENTENNRNLETKKILEIYSNDNENLAETSISDSLVKKKELSESTSVSTSASSNDNESSSDNEGSNDNESASINSSSSLNDSDNSSNKSKKSKKSNRSKGSNMSYKELNDVLNDLKVQMTNDEESVVNNQESVVNNQESVGNNEEPGINNEEKVVNNQESVGNNEETIINIEETVVNNEETVVNNEEHVVNNNDKDEDISEKEKVAIPLKNTLELLMKMKAPEIQEIAKNKNISLDRKINGITKRKNKQELIDEIIQKN